MRPTSYSSWPNATLRLLHTEQDDVSEGSLGHPRRVQIHDPSLEIGLLEFELEPPHAWIDFDQAVPGHLWQVAGRGAGRARHQAMLSRTEGELEACVGQITVTGAVPGASGSWFR